jgi:hypothetical protein
MAKKIEDVIEGMIDEQVGAGSIITIKFDDETFNRIKKETGMERMTHVLYGDATLALCKKRGYKIEYKNDDEGKRFVIDPEEPCDWSKEKSE